MAKRANPRAIKAALNYTYEEAASALGVGVPTVRTWVNEKGLPALKSKRPYIIVGLTLREFLEAERLKRKRPMGPGELFCPGCKLSKKPLGGLADYIPINTSRGRLVGICPRCDGISNRFVSKAKLADFEALLDIAVRQHGHA